MVFFHGGAFVSGSANEEIFHPNNFMKEDVILVVPNYRLGIFGINNKETVNEPNFYIKYFRIFTFG